MNGRSGRQKRVARINRAKFLEIYSEGANMTRACAESGVARSTVGYLLEHNEKFAEAFRDAENASTDALVEEARRRGKDGVSEPVGWYQGRPGGYVQRYSDNLLMFTIKAMRPEYRDKWEVTGAGGQPIQVLVANYAAPDPGKKPEPKKVPAIEGTTTD